MVGASVILARKKLAFVGYTRSQMGKSMNADIILVMKDGKIVEQGSHTELMAHGGFYSELYNSRLDSGERR